MQKDGNQREDNFVSRKRSPEGIQTAYQNEAAKVHVANAGMVVEYLLAKIVAYQKTETYLIHYMCTVQGYFISFFLGF